MPRCGALSLLQKTLHYKGGLWWCSCHCSRRRSSCQEVLHRCAQAVSRGAAHCASQVLDRGAHADARGASHVLDRGVQTRPFPAAPLVVRCMYMAVTTGARTDACGRSFAVVSPHERTKTVLSEPPNSNAEVNMLPKERARHSVPASRAAGALHQSVKAV